jgi:hypothetical protein
MGEAVRLAGETLNAGGRIVYLGSGLDGMLGVIGEPPPPPLPRPCPTLCSTLRGCSCVPSVGTVSRGPGVFAGCGGVIGVADPWALEASV